jgi:hypothetical protein
MDKIIIIIIIITTDQHWLGLLDLQFIFFIWPSLEQTCRQTDSPPWETRGTKKKLKNPRNKVNPPQSKWLAIRDCKKITTKSRKGHHKLSGAEIGQ